MTTRDTILAIDEDPGIAALVCDVLGQAGYRGLVAASEDEALLFLRAFKVQLVITDALRPNHSADQWATLDTIRAAAGDAALVICSGHDQHDYADHAAHGYAALLPKPF